MTTSVKITAHNHPCRVTVMDRYSRQGAEGDPPENIVSGYTVHLKDGAVHETHVTDTRTVIVEELPR